MPELDATLPSIAECRSHLLHVQERKRQHGVLHGVSQLQASVQGVVKDCLDCPGPALDVWGTV